MAESDRTTCRIANWLLFGPGFHKERLYTPEMCHQIAENFARLKRTGHTIPRCKVGHDTQQRLARSLGFGAVGEITDCRDIGGGYLAVSISGIPREVGEAIASGFLNSGSIELTPNVQDPSDPRQSVPGQVLTGLAFLGEEQPAVRAFPSAVRPLATPRVTFADGSPVPPAKSVAKWLAAQASVVSTLSASEHVISFSQMSFTQPPKGVTAMDDDDDAGVEMSGAQMTALRDKLKAAGLDDATVSLVLKALGAQPPMPNMPTDPSGSGETAAMSRMRAKLAADVEDAEKKSKEAQAAFAAFSAGVGKPQKGRNNPVLKAMVARGSVLDHINPALAAETRNRLAGG